MKERNKIINNNNNKSEFQNVNLIIKATSNSIGYDCEQIQQTKRRGNEKKIKKN